MKISKFEIRNSKWKIALIGLCLMATAALAAEPPKEESMEVLQLRQQLYQTQLQNLQLQGQILQFNFQALGETKSRVDEEIKKRQGIEEEKKQKEKKPDETK